MAKIILPNEGKPQLLEYLLGKTANTFSDWLLMLWTNNTLSPSATTVYSTLIEATFPGYARKVLTKSSWSSATIVSNQAVSNWGLAPTTWTNTGSAQTIYGYAMVTPTAPVIIAIQQLDTPIPMLTGGTIAMTPQLILDNLT